MENKKDIQRELQDYPKLTQLKTNIASQDVIVDDALMSRLKQIPDQEKNKPNLLRWSMALAASLIIGLALFYAFQPEQASTEISWIETELLFEDVLLFEEYLFD